MRNKQIAWYLIFGGLAIFLIEFVATILAFIGDHPLLGYMFDNISRYFAMMNKTIN